MLEDVHEGCKQEDEGLEQDQTTDYTQVSSMTDISLPPPRLPPPPWMSLSSLPVTFSIQFAASTPQPNVSSALESSADDHL